jgi:predicted amidohydrolase
MEQENLCLAMLQYSIEWEDKQANLDKVASRLEKEQPKADLLVLPEMFTTGFSMKAEELAEPDDGETMHRVKHWAKHFDMAITGSFIARKENHYFNRAFFITPEGRSFFNNKRHLFAPGQENTVFTPGKERMIVTYKGWNICLQICYDLRFPVWTRNVANGYDLLLYAANWPSSRILAWNLLLPARAVENQSYVCGVNRVGEDGLNVKYNGCSSIYDMKGELLTGFESEEGIKTAVLSLNKLRKFREKFPVWRDADRFEWL